MVERLIAYGSEAKQISYSGLLNHLKRGLATSLQRHNNALFILKASASILLFVCLSNRYTQYCVFCAVHDIKFIHITYN